MSTPSSVRPRRFRRLISLLVALAFALGVILLMLKLAGKFDAKVPSQETFGESDASEQTYRTETARIITRPRVEAAVGSVRAVHEIAVGSKLLARVVEINVKAGQKVREGDVLARLDDADLRARLAQARAALAAAEAARTQAAADQRRYAPLVETKTISRQEYDRVVTALQTAEADVQRAKEAVNEVQVMLDWATVRSPIDGTVIDKRVEAGDMVSPGQLLLTLYDPTRMQLVAGVRESLAMRLSVGEKIGVRLDVLDKVCQGEISEIVPEANTATRTFQVKVTGPCPPGVHSGMFGRILVPLGEEQVLVVPRAAVREVGQLQLVEVLENGRPFRRSIRVGRRFGDDVEVLSGLAEGEQVVIPEAQALLPSGKERGEGLESSAPNRVNNP